MKQPVMNKIKESGVYKEPHFYTLLIDANNLFKISCLGYKKLNNRGENIGGIYQFLLQVRIMLSKLNFKHVYCFWDGEQSGKLRYDIYPDYKKNRHKSYSDYDKNLNDFGKMIIDYSNKKKGIQPKPKNEEDEDFLFQKEKLHLYLEELFIRQIVFENIESDDLIAYYCLNKQPNEKIYILSGDKDLTQLLADDIAIWNPSPSLKRFVTKKNHKEIYGIPHDNVLITKMICGDASDNIKGVKGVGEKTLHEIIPEIKHHKIELNDVLTRVKELNEERVKNKLKPLKSHQNMLNEVSDGCNNGNVYEINRTIIDLSKPLLTEDVKKELDETLNSPLDPTERGFENVYKLIIEDDIYDLFDTKRFSTFFEPYKKLIDNEKEFFKINI